MGYYYDIGDDEYYYYIVDNYYGNNIIYYDENEDNYLLDVNALNALNANDEDNSYPINSPYGLAYYASKVGWATCCPRFNQHFGLCLNFVSGSLKTH